MIIGVLSGISAAQLIPPNSIASSALRAITKTRSPHSDHSAGSPDVSPTTYSFSSEGGVIFQPSRCNAITGQYHYLISVRKYPIFVLLRLSRSTDGCLRHSRLPAAYSHESSL